MANSMKSDAPQSAAKVVCKKCGGNGFSKVQFNGTGIFVECGECQNSGAVSKG